MPQYNGVWTLEAAAQAQSNQQWVTDPNFRNTTLLLQADNAASGAQNNTFLDESNNSFAITRNGNTTQGTFTPFSQSAGRWSAYFVSGYPYISFPNNAGYNFGTGDFTLEFWFYGVSIGSDARFISNAAYTASGIDISWESSQSRITWYIGSTSYNTNTLPSLNAWHHIAFSRSGTTLYVFVDGVLKNTYTGVSANITSANALNVGGYTNGTATFDNNYISNVRLVKGTALYTSAFTPSASPLTSVTNTTLLTLQDNRFKDNSTIGAVPTVNGTVAVQAFSPFAPQYQWTAPVIGGSGYFDGTGDYLAPATNLPAISTGQAFTIEMWVYAPSAVVNTNGAGLFGGISNAINFVVGVPSTNNLTYGKFGVSNTISPGGACSITPGSWNHVVVCRNTTSASAIFVNGTRQGSSTTDTNSFVAATYNIANNNSNFFPGYISSLRFVVGTAVYDPTLTTLTIPTAPLTAITNTSLLLNFTNAGIYDGTMKSNLETVGNAQVSTSVVKYGSGSLRLNGTTDYVNFPVPPSFYFGTGDFTVEMWANFSTTTGSSVLIGNFNNNTTAFGIWTLYWYSTGNLAFFCLGGTAYQVAWTPVPNTWYHIAVSRANSRLRWFINGVQTGATFASTDNLSFASGLTQPGGWNIGRSNDGAAYFNGYMDDIRVTPGVARYISNFIPPQVALPRQ